MVPRDPGEVLMENKVARTYLRRADFEVSAKVAHAGDDKHVELNYDPALTLANATEGAAEPRS